MSLGSFSVRNPVFINIITLSLLILGYLSLRFLPREQYAEVPFFWVSITVPYPGAGARDIEQLITIPVENEMQGLDDLDEVRSVSGDGLSTVSVRFKSNIDQDKFDKLFQEVRTRFSQAALPENTLKERISSFSSNDFTPVIEIVLSGDVLYKNLADTAEKIAEEIDSVNGVSQVNLIGLREKRVVVLVDQEKVDSYSLSLEAVVNALQAGNINVPSGKITGSKRDFLVRTTGEVNSINEFGDIVVRKDRANRYMVRIKDVAVTKEELSQGTRSRYNGSQAVTLRVSKVPGGNSVLIAERVKEILGTWEKRLTDDIRLTTLNDSTVQIRSSLQVLQSNALLGLAFLIVILFLFIGLRNALMTALGVPLSLAITFIILDLMGETFNSNTLFGLVLVLGLIVDHAIVIIENSFRLQQKGLDRHQAAISGTDQVIMPVAAATATTIAAFLPLMLLPGTLGRFLRIIPLTVSIALIASTAEALIVLPSHYADWPGRIRNVFSGTYFLRFQRGYTRILIYLYERKKRVLTLGGIALVFIFSLAATLQQDLFSAEDFSVFYIDIKMPPGTTREETDRIVRLYEEKIFPFWGNGEIVSVSSYVGFTSSNQGNSQSGDLAQILVELTEKNQGRERSIPLIMGEIREETRHIPGPENVFFRRAVNGPPQSPPVSFRLFGNSLEGLKEASSRIREKLSQYPVLLNVEDDHSGGLPELRIYVNEERASSYGLSVFAVGQFIRAAVDGIDATTFISNNESTDVVVKLKNAENIGPGELEMLMIPLPDGRKIPFSAVARTERQISPSAIKRVDGKRVVTIQAEAYDKESVPEINEAIESLVVNEFSLAYPDLELVPGGEFAEFSTLLVDILKIFLVGIFLIYLILGTQFRSYSQPFLILLSVPVAFAGVILYLSISRTPFSTTVLYAGVALAGIAVNDAIVLISFINELKETSRGIKEAVLEAAETRLRPIVLTSLTTIAGLLPTAVGLGGRSVVWQPMASTIIFGILFSTLTALFIVPLIYGLFYDKAQGVQRMNLLKRS